MSPMSCPWLPLDVYVHILNQLPISLDTDDSSTRTLSNCCQASSQIRAAAIISSIWEPHYRARYTLAVPEREAARVEKHTGDWRLMFYDRRRLDCLAMKLLEEIIEQRSDRISRAKELCSLSFDVWNAMDRETRCVVPEMFCKPGDEPGAVVPANHALTRRYWAKQVQGVIARHRAIGLWAHLRLQGPDDVLSFEEVLAGLSTFFGHIPSEV
jgi:F-box protein 21